MGVIADDLGLDCAHCHPNAGTDQVNWVVDTPPKRTARRMIEMVATINRTNFGGVQRVTCWTCHHGRDVPATTIALDTLYETPNMEKEDIVTTGTGTAFGNPDSRQVHFRRSAERNGWPDSPASSPLESAWGTRVWEVTATLDLRKGSESTRHDHQVQRPSRSGGSTWAFSGPTGWIKSPAGSWAVELTGGELDGARLEAQMAFPGQINDSSKTGGSARSRASAIATTRLSRGPAPGTFSPLSTSTRRRACWRG